MSMSTSIMVSIKMCMNTQPNVYEYNYNGEY